MSADPLDHLNTIKQPTVDRLDHLVIKQRYDGSYHVIAVTSTPADLLSHVTSITDWLCLVNRDTLTQVSEDRLGHVAPIHRNQWSTISCDIRCVGISRSAPSRFHTCIFVGTVENLREEK